MSIEIGPCAYAICSVADAIINESAMIFFQNNYIDMHAWYVATAIHRHTNPDHGAIHR